MPQTRHQTSPKHAAARAVANRVRRKDFPPLTKLQMAELRRRVVEARDPARYLIVSAFTRRFILYYDAVSDGYVMNRPEDGTAFKNRRVAEAVLAALQGRRRRKDHSLQLVTARKIKSGVRLVEKPVCYFDRLRAKRRRIKNRKSKI